MSEELSHLNASGEANMVDISGKSVSHRVAVAQSLIRMQPATLTAIRDSQIEKGEALSVARIAGIQAAKRCADLIPLCHPLPLNKVQIDFEYISEDTIQVQATCIVDGKTGVEMEALTAASVAALTIYDMAKALDKGMVILNTCLLQKDGGKSGAYRRSEEDMQAMR
ncbi:MAG: cyclic pyranopterin monophosphate synthase MoaC [Pseudomonadota bacterium]